VLRSRIPAWGDTGLNGGDSLSNYITTHFFQDYWKKYHVQVTLCDADKSLKIQPQGFLMNCKAYFQGLITNYGKSTATPNLHFLDYGVGKEFYLAAIHLPVQGAPPGREQTVFIELSLKNSYPDPGYPGLLMDKSRIEITALPDYSYGFYKNGWLVRAFGAYSYKMELAGYNSLKNGQAVFSSDNMLHYQYRINDSDMLLISKKEENLLSLLAPFSYLFILFSVIVLIISGIVAFPKEFRLFPVSLRNRLQLSLIGILVLTMFAVGIIQVMNIVHINSKKNNDNLKEKAYSILVEVQHKYGTFTETPDGRVLGLSDFLVKLSNVFFTDINVYNDRGLLLASSRPQIFEEGLLSERMNASAFEKLVIEKNSMFIHSESIGSMHFNSAYLPFYDENDRLIGFINLPYFIKQDEAKKEISSFLVTFINIYILLILLGMVVIVVISNHITAPLAVLAGKISKLRLGSVNEKIPWHQKDEIGQLVAEYNRMIDELGRSAEIRARSEREGAWRQMARQVAHEIKNPLTPMKLSAQYLEKAWNEKAPDWDQRLARFTKTLVEQIDALSVIASDFSDFARMPEVEFAEVNMEEVVRFVLSMYEDTSPIRFEFHGETTDPVISADRSQMVRLLTNLLNNAVQAISDPSEGVIVVRLSREPGWMILSVTDNGCGITPDRFERIFQPDFTTKTNGMGLGLAIVKGIVDSMHGSIAVSSEERNGTAFIIKLPVHDIPRS
jgi:signal transduction histidine kinase